MPKRAAPAEVEKVLHLYGKKYFDLNLRHFHEKLQSEHQVTLSYSWVKGLLQGRVRWPKGASGERGGRGDRCPDAPAHDAVGIAGFRTSAGTT